VIASGNYQSRDRTQLSYFEFNRNKWLDNPAYFLNFTGDTVRNVDERYPDHAMAMDKYAGNVFVNYDPAEKIKFSLSTGAQHSTGQRVSTENEVTPLSTVYSGSRYADFRANMGGLSTQFYYNGGTQSTDADAGRKYDFRIAGGNIEYNFSRANFSVKPGLSFTSAVYDDRKYSDLINETGLLNNSGNITTKSASLRGEYKLLYNKLRLVAGMATSTFNYPDTTYISYQFAATYKLNKKHLFRMVYSSAPRSSNIFDTYVTKTVAYYPTGNHTFTKMALEGDKNPKLLTANMFEIGYRGNIASGLDIDVELFSMRAGDYNTPVPSRPYTQINGIDTVLVMPIRSTTLPMVLQQHGITVSLTWHRGKLEAKPFITLQHTDAKNYAPFITMPDAGTPGAAQYNIYSGIGSKETLKSTPSVFGGASFNYAPAPKFNINLSAYYYSSQVYYHISNILFNDGVRGIDHINAKLIINTSLSYAPAKGVNLFCTGKNLLNDASREFFKTDAVPFMLLGGIRYEF
jgi:iron complex outermembrane recepter protein